MPYKNPADRKKQWRRWADNNPERASEHKRKHVANNRERVNQIHRDSKARNPQREYANGKLRFAVKRGWLQRPEGKIFHHSDYSRPYFGCWVTPHEHARLHAGLIPCPECTDYSAEILEARNAGKQ